MKYKVEITETLQKTIEVEASNKSEAIAKIKELYYKGNIILDSESFIDADIDILEE